MRWKRGSEPFLYLEMKSGLNEVSATPGKQVKDCPTKNYKVIFCCFNAFHVLIVELRLDEGLIVLGVANGGLIDRQYLNYGGMRFEYGSIV